MKTYNWQGWLVFGDLDIPDGGGVKIEYRRNGRLEPACLFPNLSEEELFAAHNHQDWNWATEYCGLVPEYLIRDNRVYWNYYVNFNGMPESPEQDVVVTRYAEGGRVIDIAEQTVAIDNGKTVFLNNWLEWEGASIHTFENMEPNRTHDPAGAESGWTIANCTFGQPRLTLFGSQKVPPISYCPKVSGRYDLYLCLKEEVLECELELPGEKETVTLLVNPRIIPFNKFWKELYIGQYSFGVQDRIGIRQSMATVYNPACRFGDIFYLKLVPAVRKEEKVPFASGEIVFYSEPYSIAYFHSLQNEKMAESLVERYVELGVDKIICQMGRTGSFMLYPSKVVKRGREGFVRGDDQQSSNGVEEMISHMDILKVLPPICRRRGIRFLANIGVNSSRQGSTLEAKFSMEHPEYYHHHLLDFSIPEVMEFAAEQFRELAEYDIDGISVGHTRYPYWQTKKTIVTLHRKIVEKIAWKRRKELEMNIIFPVDNPDYYEALKILLEEDLVDSLIPGRLMSLYPKINVAPYVELASRYGKKVYGTLDGWGLSHTGMNTSLIARPAEMLEQSEAYIAQGADGLYFYQSEQILSNPFLRRFLKSLKTV
jgi:hypothetical protein